MDLGRRVRLVVAVLALLALAILLSAFLLAAFAVLLAVGAALALAFYVRLRLLARRLRKRLEAERARQEPAAQGPRDGAIDAEFKVER